MAPDCVRALRDALQRQQFAVQVPYLSHSLAVARRLVQMGAPSEVLCAAILHECYEQGLLGLEEVAASYGLEAATLLSDNQPTSTLGRLFRCCDRLQHLEELTLMGLPPVPEAINCLWASLGKLPPRFRGPLSEELEQLTGTRPVPARVRGQARYPRRLVRPGLSSDLN